MFQIGQKFLTHSNSEENKPESAIKSCTTHQLTDEWLNAIIDDDENNVEGNVSDTVQLLHL